LNGKVNDMAKARWNVEIAGLARTGRLAAIAGALALAATGAPAQEPPPAPGTGVTEAQLEEAQARLEQAAREIAELTAQMVGEAGVTALSRLEELTRGPRPVMLGVTIGAVGEPEAREEGVQILGVTPGSSAEAAGIQSGDVLLAIGDVTLDWSGEASPVSKLLESLDGVEPGTQLEVRYRREGQVATATLEARPWSWPRAFALESERMMREMPAGAHQAMRRFMVDSWGDMELVELTPGLGEYFQVTEGVLVVRAPADDLLGLREGDVIVDIAGRTPADPRHVARILRSYAPGERLVMTVVRKGQRETLEADIPG
jgi:type II secretory pathway component PulC